MKFVSPLSKTDLQDLDKARRSASAQRTRDRAHAILLSAKGYKVNTLADIFDVDRDTISRWIDAWQASHLEGLTDQPHPGRPPILSSQDREKLSAIALREPSHSQQIHAQLRQETGKAFSQSTLIRELKKCGLTFKRIRHSVKCRRDEAKFSNAEGAIDALRQAEKDGEIDLFFFDETGFSTRSSIPYGWQRKGEAYEQPCFHASKRLNVMGFLSVTGKCMTHSQVGSVKSAHVIAAFDQLLQHYGGDKWCVVVLDNASVHRSQAFQEARRRWLKKRIVVLYLPAYSPELNLIEVLWRRIKYSWLPLSAHENFESLCAKVREVLASYGKKYVINFA